MTYHRAPTLFLLTMSLAMPLSALASFAGPTQSPPGGNVPGVVWNRSAVGGAAGEQSGADFNISGSGRLGGDFILGDAKALRIDKAGPATFNIGNWGSGMQPLSVNIYGDLVTNPTGVGLGQSEGKITAPKFCLGTDCITSWSAGGSGSGDVTDVVAGAGILVSTPSGPSPSVAFDASYGDNRYVNITGDTMTGQLTVNAAGGAAVVGNGPTGGAFDGTVSGVNARGLNYGITAYTALIGTGTAVQGFNGDVGGDFSGATYGVKTNGGIYGYYSDGNPSYGFYAPVAGTYGVYGQGDTSGGYFRNGINSSYAAYLGYNGYGGYFTSPAGSFSIYGTENMYVGGNTTLNGGASVNGDLDAAGNSLDNCAWTSPYVADGASIICPASTPIMSGIQRSGTSMRAYCCDL